MTMTGQHVSPKSAVFQDMAALTLEAGFFTSEFRLCDTIAEYLATIVGQSHEDPARYANFSSLLTNEIAELAFRSVGPAGRIDFNLLKNERCVRIHVGFQLGEDSRDSWSAPASSAAPEGQDLARDLRMMAQALSVKLSIDTGANDRVTLIADFILQEGIH
jgi:hypothetical protein